MNIGNYEFGPTGILSHDMDLLKESKNRLKEAEENLREIEEERQNIKDQYHQEMVEAVAELKKTIEHYRDELSEEIVEATINNLKTKIIMDYAEAIRSLADEEVKVVMIKNRVKLILKELIEGLMPESSSKN